LHPKFYEMATVVMQDIINEISPKVNLPKFDAGDNVSVYYKIKEGNKERTQLYQGVVIQRNGAGSTATFTVRKISNGVGVERIFPDNSPSIEKLEVNRRGRVRRSKIYYLRDLKGKASRIKERYNRK
jgi:large subunit ribosomal protein L19